MLEELSPPTNGTTGWISPATGFAGRVPKSSGWGVAEQGGRGREEGGEDDMGPGVQGVHRGTQVEHGQTPTEGDQRCSHCILIESHDLQTARATGQKL